MLRTWLLSIAFVLGTTSPILADDLVRPTNLPQCTKYQVASGTVCGYENLEDWKAVLRADEELTHLRTKLKNEEEKSRLLALQVQSLIIENGALEKNQSILTQHRDKLTTDLIALDKKYQDERVKPRWGSPIAWAIAGVSTAVLAGFLVNSVVN